MSQGQPLHPLKHALQIFTDTLKEGWGTDLNKRTTRGTRSLPESKLHKNNLELKVVFLTLKKVPRPPQEQYSAHSCRQHHSSCLHKQREGDEVGPSVCPSVENPDLVYRKTCYSQSLTHSRPADCGSRQGVQARLDHSEWSLLQEVFHAICQRWHQPQ